MIQALPDESAFSRHLTPYGLWRASCPWEAQGISEQAEWLHEMAVDLIKIHDLPETDELPALAGQATLREIPSKPRESAINDADIPF